MEKLDEQTARASTDAVSSTRAQTVVASDAAAEVAPKATPAVRIAGYTFAYPGGEPVLDHISLEVAEGAFCVVVGPTGCGKTTLLRALKPELARAGSHAGTIEVLGHALVRDGRVTGELAAERSAREIGFVAQDPAAQIVCDTVWHELAFGLENIGTPAPEMRRRIAEVAHFFGIEALMHAACEELSGGQQQLVNLAAVLALRPRLIVLDEPTAQLDPHARRQFLYLLGRVRRELGITVMLSTHAPEETETLATQTLTMGTLSPLARREDAERLLEPRRRTCEHALAAAATVVTAHDLHVRYRREDPWVLRGVDLAVRRGTIHLIVGGNGCGKSTLLAALAGVRAPQRGSVDNALAGRQALLPQDPKALFVCDTVAEELAEWRDRCGYTAAEERALVARLSLTGLKGASPLDLSGGQQQKLALAKLLLTKPELLFLDEPTKGLDPASAAECAEMLHELADAGCTIVGVTHDLDFACAVADEVSMLFDGEIACTEPARAFFAHNLIYRPHDASRFFGALLERMDEGRAGGSEPTGAAVATGAGARTNPGASAGPDTSNCACRASRTCRTSRADETTEAAPNNGPHKTTPHRARGVVEALALAAVPAVLAITTLAGVRQTAILSFAVVIAALGIFFASFEASGARLRELMPTVVLAALAAAGRIVFAAVPSMKPVSAIAIIAGVVLGRRSGFMVGALAALASNFFFGQGPWTPWQMYAWGLVGWGAGALAQTGVFGVRPGATASPTARRHVVGTASLLAYGFVSSVVYGWILNAWTVLGFLHAHTTFQVLAVYAASLPFDIAHGVATVGFLLALWAPWQRKLARVLRSYAA